MNKELLTEGRDLANFLAEESKRFNVKSDQHEILGYESAILTAKVDFYELNKPIEKNLKESALLGRWGDNFFSTEWKEIKEKVRSYYERLESKNNT